METTIKKKRSKLFELMRTLYSFIIIFCIPGAIITFGVPSYTIELTRVNPERVDATVSRNSLFIVPISRYTATNLIDTESEVIDGGLIRRSGSTASSSSSTGKITGEAEYNGSLLLKGREGEPPIELEISPVNLYDVEDEIQYFITEGKELSLRLWVVSNWKFGVILPGGILLFWVVVFCMAVWSIITGKEWEFGKSGSKNEPVSREAKLNG
mgnify:CR=1 FL=1